MKILNYGSLNVDVVYQVKEIVKPGETIECKERSLLPGGKGLNQAIALAKAGATVFMAGAVGEDGADLMKELATANVDISNIQVLSGFSGHAIIQVSDTGANSIITCGGANKQITKKSMEQVFLCFGPGDVLLLQNEISNISFAIAQAKKRGMKIALNPSPINSELLNCDLKSVDYLILNEIEGQTLAGLPWDSAGTDILNALETQYPDTCIVLTLGESGVLYADKSKRIALDAYMVDVVDTTAAGDTFCGYFLACMANGYGKKASLEYATKASALCIKKLGAAVSIPTIDAVASFKQ